MILHGREVRLAYTVGAMQDISRLCPDNDIRRIGEIFPADETSPLDLGIVVKFVSILSYWGEEKRRWEEPGYERKPFTVEELNTFPGRTINELLMLGLKTMNEDSEQTVETEPERSSKKE